MSLSLGMRHKVLHVLRTDRIEHIEEELAVNLLTLGILSRDELHKLQVPFYFVIDLVDCELRIPRHIHTTNL